MSAMSLSDAQGVLAPGPWTTDGAKVLDVNGTLVCTCESVLQARALAMLRTPPKVVLPSEPDELEIPPRRSRR